MATLKDFRDERIKKLTELKALGFNPYPSQTKRTHKIADITRDFDQMIDQEVSIVGRVKSIRKFGKIAFIVIKDETGSIQLFLATNHTNNTDPSKSTIGLENLNLLDTGDFLEATGKLAYSKTGEQSINAENIKLLTKALRPLPLDHEEFKDKEERLRRRYIDIATNEDVKARFERRSRFWQATREFLLQHDFIEINIPVLESTTGGADATPFVTHMDALDEDYYLRISHELPLKRLLGAGYERVFDIGPRFRNEGMDEDHLPEHVAMEWYAAYWNWHDGMDFMERMYKYVIEKTFGTLKFSLPGFDQEIDFASKWEVWDYNETIKKHYGLDVFTASLEEIKKVLKEHNLEVAKTENRARGIDKLWKNIRKNVAGPVWLVNPPKFISPLAKSDAERSEVVERFQPIIAGSELGNGFSELNDPLDQLERFREQQEMRDAGDDEAMMLDIDFVEMLEYGMPPACGWGYSERVFWVLEGISAREGVPFPHMRHEISNTTKEIYDL